MNLKKKVTIFVAIIGLILLIISFIGYFYAQKQVKEGIEAKMTSALNAYGYKIDGWMLQKAQTAVTTGNTIQTVLDTNDVPLNFLQSFKSDPQILDLYIGLENGVMVDGAQEDLPSDYDPRKRGWYKQALEKKSLIFTDAYVDAGTKKYIITAAIPVTTKQGTLKGVVGMDISLDTLSNLIKEVNLDGSGYGFIFDHSGVVLASPDQKEVSTNLHENAVFKDSIDKILENNTGVFSYKNDDGTQLMLYTTIPSTGWRIAIVVPEADAYNALGGLKIEFAIITLLGIFISLLLGLGFVKRLVKNISILTVSAQKMANGDLSIQKLNINSKDEIGQLANAFSTMSGNLRNLIQHIADTSSQVADASDKINVITEQSSQTMVQIANSISDVALGTTKQQAKIDTAASVIEKMS